MFNGAQLHLLVNHLPIVGFALYTPVFLVAAIRGSRDLKRLALLGVALLSITAVPAFLSGEPAEEVIEDFSGVRESQIEEHEEAAEFGLIVALTTGIMAAAGWLLSRNSDKALRGAMPLTALGCLATIATMAKIGHEGGKIRHPEISESTTGAAEGAWENKDSSESESGESDND